MTLVQIDELSTLQKLELYQPKLDKNQLYTKF
jgi:hypothetical protein